MTGTPVNAHESKALRVSGSHGADRSSSYRLEPRLGPHRGQQPLLRDNGLLGLIPVVEAPDNDGEVGQVDHRSDAEGVHKLRWAHAAHPAYDFFLAVGHQMTTPSSAPTASSSSAVSVGRPAVGFAGAELERGGASESRVMLPVTDDEVHGRLCFAERVGTRELVPDAERRLMEKTLDRPLVFLVAELNANDALLRLPPIETEREHPTHLVFRVGVGAHIGGPSGNRLDQLVDDRGVDVDGLCAAIRVPRQLAGVAY